MTTILSKARRRCTLRWTGVADQASANGGFTFALDLHNHVTYLSWRVLKAK